MASTVGVDDASSRAAWLQWKTVQTVWTPFRTTSSVLQCRDETQRRRAAQLAALLRPGLHAMSKRKASNWISLDDPTVAPPRLETSEGDRRSRLKLRDGLPRRLPKCRFSMESLPLSEARVSDWTHVTPLEGIPEKWMEPRQRETSEFCFTPIEGVLERMTIGRPSSLPPRLSVFSDVEGIPERQWMFPVQGAKHMGPREGRGSTSHPEQRLSHQSGATQESRHGRLDTVREPTVQRTVSLEARSGVEVTGRISLETVQGQPTSPLYRQPSPHMQLQPSPQPFPSPRSEISPIPCQPSISERAEISVADPPEHSVEPEQTIIHDVPFQKPTDIKRSSLLGSDVGMQWVNGCRRSQRNRCKPLRWWDGEHKVYGRQHNTLATVTGYVTKSPKPEWPRPSPKTSRTKRSR